MTNEKLASFVDFFGAGLIAFGALFVAFNWIFCWMNYSLRKSGENGHVSMVGVLGIALPMGSLLFDSLRLHALWIWLLDPWAATTVWNLLRGKVRGIEE